MFTLTARTNGATMPTPAAGVHGVTGRGAQLEAPGCRGVFSDGDDRTSHATIHAVEQAVRANDATRSWSRRAAAKERSSSPASSGSST